MDSLYIPVRRITTLPKEVLKELDVSDGDIIEAVKDKNRVILKKFEVDKK